MFDVVTIGNAIIDGFLSIHDANRYCSIKDSELCVKSGQKILLDSCEFQLGGGACNVGVGLSRLGNSIAVVAEVGSDEFAEKIIHTLTNEHIDTAFLKKIDKQSSFTLGLNFKGERTLFTHQSKGPHDFDFNFTTNLLYLAAIGNEWKNAYKKVVKYVTDKKSILAFNPGPLQIEEGVNSLENVLQVTDILFLNIDEAQSLAQQKNNDTKNRTVEELLKEMRQSGPQVVVLTDGSNGSYAIDIHTTYFSKAAEATVVEKTGAGDAYSSGFLAALVDGKDVPEAMEWGAINAAAVIEQIGAQKGLLGKEEIKLKR